MEYNKYIQRVSFNLSFHMKKGVQILYPKWINPENWKITNSLRVLEAPIKFFWPYVIQKLN